VKWLYPDLKPSFEEFQNVVEELEEVPVDSWAAAMCESEAG